MTNQGVDITAPAIRVNFELMAQYIGKRVRLVGRVENGGVQNGILRVKAADEGLVQVLVHGAVPQDMYVEIDGTVEAPDTIREESIVGYGNNFGELVLNLAEQLIIFSRFIISHTFVYFMCRYGELQPSLQAHQRPVQVTFPLTIDSTK